MVSTQDEKQKIKDIACNSVILGADKYGDIV